MSLYRFKTLDDQNRPFDAAVPLDRLSAIWRDPDGTVWLRDDTGESWQVFSPTFDRLADDIDDRLRRRK